MPALDNRHTLRAWTTWPAVLVLAAACSGSPAPPSAVATSSVSGPPQNYAFTQVAALSGDCEVRTLIAAPALGLVAAGRCVTQPGRFDAVAWQSADARRWTELAREPSTNFQDAVASGHSAMFLGPTQIDAPTQVWTPASSGQLVATDLPNTQEAYVSAIAGSPASGYLAVGNEFSGGPGGTPAGVAWSWAGEGKTWQLVAGPSGAEDLVDVVVGDSGFTVGGWAAGGSSAVWRFSDGQWGAAEQLPFSDLNNKLSGLADTSMVTGGTILWTGRGVEWTDALHLPGDPHDSYWEAAVRVSDGIVATAVVRPPAGRSATAAEAATVWTAPGGVGWAQTSQDDELVHPHIVSLVAFGEEVIGLDTDGVIYAAPARIN